VQFINTYKIYLTFVFLGVVVLQFQNITGPIIDQYGFRQAQTAISTLWFLNEGLSFPYLTPVFGWPWSVPFEFPTYQIVVYWISILFHFENLDLAGRLVSLFFYYLSFIPIVLILKRLMVDTKSIMVILISILATPIYIFWPRTFMMESMALFFTLMAIYLVISYEAKNQKNYYLLMTFVILVLAALTKITTFLVGLMFLSFYFLIMKPDKIFQSKVFKIALVVGGAILIGFAWTKYTDVIKNMNDIASHVSSTNLSKWNFGTLKQRMDIQSYYHILNHIIHNSGYVIATIILFPIFIFKKLEYKKLIYISLLTYIASFFVLFNLYYAHNYYWYASSIFLSIALGLIMATALKDIKNIFLLHISLIVFIVFSLSGYYQYYYDFQVANYKNNFIVAMGNMIKHEIKKNDVIYIKGLDWSSELPYYADRKAIMVPGWDGIDINDPRFENILKKSLSSESKIGALVLCDLNELEMDQRLKYFNFGNSPDYADGRCYLFTKEGYSEKFKKVEESMYEMSKNISAPWNPRLQYYKNKLILWAHMPSKTNMIVPNGAIILKFGYGVMERAYLGDGYIKGACFKISNDVNLVLWAKCIDPKNKLEDRNILFDEMKIPTGVHQLTFETLPNKSGDGSWGHTFWADVKLTTSKELK